MGEIKMRFCTFGWLTGCRPFSIPPSAHPAIEVLLAHIFNNEPQISQITSDNGRIILIDPTVQPSLQCSEEFLKCAWREWFVNWNLFLTGGRKKTVTPTNIWLLFFSGKGYIHSWVKWLCSSRRRLPPPALYGFVNNTFKNCWNTVQLYAFSWTEKTEVTLSLDYAVFHGSVFSGIGFDIKCEIKQKGKLICCNGKGWKNCQFGAQIVEWLRAHATYASDLGLNPSRRTYAACCTPLLSHFLSIHCNINVPVPGNKKELPIFRWFTCI